LASLDANATTGRTDKKLAELAKNNQNGSFKGNQFKKVVSEPDEADTTTGRTDQKLADIAGVGKMTATRLKKESAMI
jgi:hypothetical protein